MILTKDEKAAQAKERLSDLHQLIEALDRRLPQFDRTGEAQTVLDAADLRERAVNLIHHIEGEPPTE